MKLAWIALLLATTFSIEGQVKRPDDAQVLAGLRFEAHKRHLRWMVICVPAQYGEGQHYSAYAEHDSVPLGARYIEDGDRDEWYQTGQTAIEAAYNLYLALANNKPENLHAEHRPGISPENPKGCNLSAVYDSEHDRKIPCED